MDFALYELDTLRKVSQKVKELQGSSPDIDKFIDDLEQEVQDAEFIADDLPF